MNKGRSNYHRLLPPGGSLYYSRDSLDIYRYEVANTFILNASSKRTSPGKRTFLYLGYLGGVDGVFALALTQESIVDAFEVASSAPGRSGPAENDDAWQALERAMQGLPALPGKERSTRTAYETIRLLSRIAKRTS